MGNFNQKYRIESARLRNWDYGWAGLYFITICTKRRDASRLFNAPQGYDHSGRRDASRLFNWFGEIEGGIMRLSDIGKIVETEWERTFELRPDMNLYMGEYVVMPDHFHAIIGIGENGFNMKMDVEMDTGINMRGRDAMHRVSTTPPRVTIIPGDAMHRVSTSDIVPPTSDIIPPKNQFGPQSKNLASIVRGFKSAVTKNARLIHPDFAWQSRFYDRIIRDYAAYQNISYYIKQNPANWL